MHAIKKEWDIFRTSVMFFTRIPVGRKLNYSERYLNSSTKYLPVIGWMAGGLSAFIFYLMVFILPVNLAILFSMVSSILLTGAFHEDGFADVCDGFGGGWTKSGILTIMKDSRIGAYGMIGMSLMLFGKYAALQETSISLIPLVILSSHTVSRFFAVLFVFTSHYVREDETSKVKPVGKKISFPQMAFAFISALLPMLWFPSLLYLLVLPCLYGVFYFFKRYTHKWIGGYTGDCLGAMQQLTELAFYIFVILLETHIYLFT
jgi:adenosylcobinamide-GDP ribazoletransferase